MVPERVILQAACTGRRVATWLGVTLVLGCGSPAAAPCPQVPTLASSTKARPKSTHTAKPEGEHHQGGDAPLVRRFVDAEKWAKRFAGPERDAWQKPEVVMSALKLEPSLVVADIGAGGGYFVPHLLKGVGETGRVLAIDVEPTMVRYLAKMAQANGWPNVDARLCAVGDPVLPDASVDRIIIVNTWHHIPERRAYSKLLFDALRPAGRVMVVDFTQETKQGPKKHHRVRAAAIEENFRAAGFTVHIDRSLPDQYMVIGDKLPK